MRGSPLQLLAISSLITISSCSGFAISTNGKTRGPSGQLKTFRQQQQSSADGQVDGNGQGTLFFERIESIKFVAVGVLSGSASSIPPSIGLGMINGFDAQWELSHDFLALSLVIYSLVYRYAFRDGDTNEMQKMGVIGGFSATRALAAVKVSDACSPFPISCSISGWLQTALAPVETFVESYIVFTAAAMAFEYFTDKGILRRFKGL